mmetsp:Transcript_81594/g.128462  ORF Transcript_81594/g.128462 Transcript_81594/m.128462 type:complete len:699 (+) Transcript_81594:69-2165(+)
MFHFGHALILCLAGVAAVEVTPIEKVINLLEGMKTEVEEEAKTEAASYTEFACFCKDETKSKSESVNKAHDSIDVLSADIADKTQSKKKDSTELSDRKAKQEELAAKLQSETVRCAKEKATYEASAADLSKAISSLTNAIKAMKDSKPAAFLQGSVHQDLMETLAMADAMSLVTSPKRKAVASMIQGEAKVDPSDPEYQYHSNDIISLLESLETDFKDQKTSLDDEYSKTKKSCDELKASLKEEMSTNDDAMKALEKNIDKLGKEIASAREDLVESQEGLKDDELYLKDLTSRCEERAHDWDQRSSMRNDEISALSEALKVLKDDVKGAADKVNIRALLIQNARQQAKKHAQEMQQEHQMLSKEAKKPISFLQGASLSSESRKDAALALLKSEGQRLSSVVLTSLAVKSAADPFKKVKGLIQKLIERLLAESRAEATKKGFCDTELGKARKERDFRFEETQDLSTDLEALEAKRDALTQEIKELTEEIKVNEQALKEGVKERKTTKEENMATIKTAKEGLDGVKEALLILKAFYKQAAKAAFVQASPVDEDTSGPGFTGSYKGKQSGSHAVIDLLETIASDFDRTVRRTEEAEHVAQRMFVEMEQTVKASIGSKTTKKELDEQDLKTTETSLKTKMEDLQTAQNLLDAAVKEIEGLKPTCIDTGMSYEERVAKREDEMAALKKALCILDEENVESECQ